MTLVETHPGESEADLRAAVDGLFRAGRGDGQADAFEFRGRYEHAGQSFREFDCPAGSLHALLLLGARGGWPRRVTYSSNRGLFLVAGGREERIVSRNIGPGLPTTGALVSELRRRWRELRQQTTPRWIELLLVVAVAALWAYYLFAPRAG